MGLGLELGLGLGLGLSLASTLSAISMGSNFEVATSCLYHITPHDLTGRTGHRESGVGLRLGLRLETKRPSRFGARVG